jgi:hypothetical protein
MNFAVVYDFPPFDTGLFDDAEFAISGGNARLLIRVAEHSNIVAIQTRQMARIHGAAKLLSRPGQDRMLQACKTR